MRTENRSRISSRVSTGMCALRLRSRTSRPSWQRVWIAALTVGRATPNSIARSSSGSRTPGSISPSRMRARNEATTASVVEIGWTTSPLIRPPVWSTAAAARRAPAQLGRRDGAHAAAAGLHAPPLGGAHVQDRFERGVELTRVRDHGVERAAERIQRAGALGAGDDDHPLAGPDRERDGLAGARAAGAPSQPRGRATRRRSPHRDTRAHRRAVRSRVRARHRVPAPPRAGPGRRRDRAGSRRCGEPVRT